MKNSILTKILIAVSIISLAGCASAPKHHSTIMPSHANKTTSTPIWNENSAAIWTALQHTSSAKLTAMQSTTTDPSQEAWIKLALISKQKNLNTTQFAYELMDWRKQYPEHPGNQFIPADKLESLQNATPPQHIAMLLPQSGNFSAAGQTVREGFLAAYYQNQHGTTKPTIKLYDTANTKDMAALYQQAISEGADFVIGPLVKDNVQSLSSSQNFTAPTLALNYSEHRFGSLPNNFYEYGLLPEDEANQIAKRAYESGRSKALIIVPQNPWGKRISTAFSANWKAQGGSIQDTLTYNNKTDFNQEIAKLLKINLENDKHLMKQGSNKNILAMQRRQDFDVIFLFAQPQEAHVIVPLLKYYYAGDIPVYATSSIYAGKPNPRDVDLNSVIVCDIPWRSQNLGNDRLYAVGQDAYLVSQNLPRLTQLPDFPMYGSTGALTLASNHKIHRRLPCVAVRDGSM